MEPYYRLERTADTIEAVFKAQRVGAVCWGGVDNLLLTTYHFGISADTRIKAATRLHDEIALRLGVSGVRIYRNNGAICVDVPKPDRRPVTVPAILRLMNGYELTGVQAMLGLGTDGKPLLLDITDPNVVHVLIAGTTGSGKTTQLRTMLHTLMRWYKPPEALAVLVDVQGYAFDGLLNAPNVLGHATDDIAAALAWLVSEMERRDAEQETEPALIVAIDELADVLATVPDAGVHLQRIVSRGRNAGVHVIAATQKPSAAAVGSLITANFPCRLVGRVVNARDAATATGRPDTGAHLLSGAGDFLMVGADVVRYQAALPGILPGTWAGMCTGMAPWRTAAQPVRTRYTATDDTDSWENWPWTPEQCEAVCRLYDELHHIKKVQRRLFPGAKLGGLWFYKIRHVIGGGDPAEM